MKRYNCYEVAEIGRDEWVRWEDVTELGARNAKHKFERDAAISALLKCRAALMLSPPECHNCEAIIITQRNIDAVAAADAVLKEVGDATT